MKLREPVTIICVSNDSLVLESCLEKSVNDGLPDAPQTELIVLENSRQQYTTAGAALNEGVRRARHKVCVMVHQDVYLHSLPKLEEAAARLRQDPTLGLLGAIGIDGEGSLRGRIRDRLLLTGEPVVEPRDVDSLDEVLVMATRAQLLDQPLSEDTELAWHAYAVEYGARQRRQGRRVAAADIPLTHNSLTINLARLTEAHAHVARLYPEFKTIVTTCGVIGSRPRTKLPASLESRRWRFRWLQSSLALRLNGTIQPGREILLSDIRFSIDSILEASGTDHLAVINMSDSEAQQDYDGGVCLPRRRNKFTFTTLQPQELHQLNQVSTEDSVLVTNISNSLMPRVREMLSGRPTRQGHHKSIGHWYLAGPVARVMPLDFSRPPVRPLALL